MFNVMDQICLPGNPDKPCEDAIGYGTNYCFVIDGASGLSGINIVDERSDAAWFATQVKEKLCQRLDADNDTKIEIILHEIIDEIRETYFHIATEKGIEPPSDSPSAGLALFRKRQDEIDFYGLGDCTGVITYTDGSVIQLKDTRLTALDGSVLAKMAELHQKTGISVLEARVQCNDLLLINRNKRNKDRGYWILDLSGGGIDQARTYSFPASSVKNVFVCSDGFAQLTDTFGLYKNYAALLDAVQHTSLTTLCNTLFNAQDEDPEANQFPRFKLRDDTSCLWGEWK